MRYLASAAIAAFAFLATGCTQADVATNEAKAKQVLASIQNGAVVFLSDVKSGIDALCANVPAVTTGATVASTIIGSQTGPNSTANQKNLNLALNTLNNVCAQAAANPSDPALKTLLKQAWTAYQTVKASQTTGS